VQAETAGGVEALAVARFKPRDRMPPTVAVQAPAGDALISGGADMVIEASDDHSSIASVEYRLDDGSWRPARVHNASAGEYGDALPALDEGGHTVQARATDGNGNTGFAGPVAFTVDNTPPVIGVEGVSDGAIVNTAVTPVVTITEDHLANSVIRLNDEPFTSGTSVAGEGEYALAITAEDRAGHVSQLTLGFVIDMTPPQIVISGIEDGALTNEPVTLVIEVTDPHLLEQTVLLNGEAFDSGTTVDQDGVYELEVTAGDRAGNQSAQSTGFEIDTTAPPIAVTSPEEGAAVDTPAVDIVGETESGATVRLQREGRETRSVLAGDNGAFVFEQVELDAGPNALTFSARDRADNISEPLNWTLVRRVQPDVELDGRLAAGTRVLIWADEPGYSDSVGQLTAALDASDIDYMLVDNQSDFVAHMRSRRYTVMVLVDLFNAGYGSNRFLKIDEAVRDEIGATVASGTGLVMFKTHPSNANVLTEVFGAQVKGRLPWIDALVLEDSPASRQARLNLSGDGLKLKPKDGTAVGWWPGHKHHKHRKPAFVINGYGAGQAALLGVDPGGLTDDQARRDLVEDLLDFATPDQASVTAGGVVELQWTADALNPPVTVRLHSTLPEAMSYLSVIDGDILDPTLAEWRVDADKGNVRFDAVIGLPKTAGEFEITATLYKDDDGVLSEMATGRLPVTIEQDTQALESGLLDKLDDIIGECSRQKSGKYHPKHKTGDHWCDDGRDHDKHWKNKPWYGKDRSDQHRYDKRRKVWQWDKGFHGDKNESSDDCGGNDGKSKAGRPGGPDKPGGKGHRGDSKRPWWWIFPDWLWKHGDKEKGGDCDNPTPGDNTPQDCPAWCAEPGLERVAGRLREAVEGRPSEPLGLGRSIDELTSGYRALKTMEFPGREALQDAVLRLMGAYQTAWFEASPDCRSAGFQFNGCRKTWGDADFQSLSPPGRTVAVAALPFDFVH
jgi:hypothetical protein